MKKILPVLALGIITLLMLTACLNGTVPSEEKEITAFSFTADSNTALTSDVTGTIDGTDISLTVPYGTEVTALVASFTTTGQSVSVDGTEQTSGTTANDFSSPVTYTVTAENGSTQDYAVTVTFAAPLAGDAVTHTADSVSFNMHYVPSGGRAQPGRELTLPHPIMD